MSRLPRRFTMPRARVALAAVLSLTVAGLAVGVRGLDATAEPVHRASSQEIAAALLEHRSTAARTASAATALRLAAHVPAPEGFARLGPEHEERVSADTAMAVEPARLANVRVNDPAADRYQVDQTTQSETSLAVAGQRVAVGFNDSQQALFTLTDGLDFSGYAYSTNGGASFTDGGTIPNAENFVNFGDPWLAADSRGTMYYATLAYGGDVGNLEVGVARSTDGGRSWEAPTFASPDDSSMFYQADKESLTVGRSPANARANVVYGA